MLEVIVGKELVCNLGIPLVVLKVSRSLHVFIRKERRRNRRTYRLPSPMGYPTSHRRVWLLSTAVAELLDSVV